MTKPVDASKGLVLLMNQHLKARSCCDEHILPADMQLRTLFATQEQDYGFQLLSQSIKVEES